MCAKIVASAPMPIAWKKLVQSNALAITFVKMYVQSVESAKMANVKSPFAKTSVHVAITNVVRCVILAVNALTTFAHNPNVQQNALVRTLVKAFAQPVTNAQISTAKIQLANKSVTKHP